MMMYAVQIHHAVFLTVLLRELCLLFLNKAQALFRDTITLTSLVDVKRMVIVAIAAVLPVFQTRQGKDALDVVGLPAVALAVQKT